MGTLFVNKSGRAFKITRTNGGSDVIGTLPVNAIFAWTDSWAGNGAGADYQGIYCNGMYGWIDGATGTGAFTPLIAKLINVIIPIKLHTINQFETQKI